MKKLLCAARGLHYKSRLVYSLLTALKLGMDYHLRYKIASRYVQDGDFVMDVCAGAGDFAGFLPRRCGYFGFEASPGFIRHLSAKGLKYKQLDLHAGFNTDGLKADVLVMIISLCHFRETSLHDLLEDFKKAAKKVIIVEDVLFKRREKSSLIQRTMNYLCRTDYFVPMELFTRQEFQAVMRQHCYFFQDYGLRYMVGYYGFYRAVQWSPGRRYGSKDSVGKAFVRRT